MIEITYGKLLSLSIYKVCHVIKSNNSTAIFILLDIFLEGITSKLENNLWDISAIVKTCIRMHLQL